MLRSRACMCLCVSECVIARLHCLLLHGSIGLLVGSLIISEGERGTDSVRERKEREGKGNEREAEMTALVNLPLFLASSSGR